jgi:hypothetical protein
MPNPQTIIRDGSGTRTATYQLPPGLFQYIESILVELDNGAAVAVRPTLKVETVNGRVMATKRQGESVPAGDTGTATWALRLTDEGGAGIQFDVLNVGGWLDVEATGDNAGVGIKMVADTGSMELTATEATVETTTGDLEFDSFNTIKLFGDPVNGEVIIDASDIILSGGPNDSEFNFGGNLVFIVGGASAWTFEGVFAEEYQQGATMQILTGKSLTVLNNSGNPIFRVNEDGSLQGKTGKTLTFNL